MSDTIITVIHKHFMTKYAASLSYVLTESDRPIYIGGTTIRGNPSIWFIKLSEENGFIVARPNPALAVWYWTSVPTEVKRMKMKSGPAMLIGDAMAIRIDLACPKSFITLKKVIKETHKSYRRQMKHKGVKVVKLQYC